MRSLFLYALIALLTLVAAGPLPAAETLRWYSSAQVEQGLSLYLANCAGCHGEQAQGIVADWRKSLPDGSYPPPPLNGSAHAWHHPLANLKRTVGEGSIDRGGKMPGFKSGLSDKEQFAVIAFFQSFWDEQIYLAWTKRGGLGK